MSNLRPCNIQNISSWLYDFSNVNIPLVKLFLHRMWPTYICKSIRYQIALWPLRKLTPSQHKMFAPKSLWRKIIDRSTSTLLNFVMLPRATNYVIQKFFIYVPSDHVTLFYLWSLVKLVSFDAATWIHAHELKLVFRSRGQILDLAAK